MYYNDASGRPARLRNDLNLGVFWDLPAWSVGPKGDEAARIAAVAAAGFEGVQCDNPEVARANGLACSFPGRFDSPGEIDGKVRLWKARGCVMASVHIGTGLEDDAEIDAYIVALLAAVRSHQFPLFVETHRATITQDMWRTVQMAKRHPDLLFNADLSHYYTGQEMTYGDMQAKINFLTPVLARTGFMHGRIGTSGNIQVRLDDPAMVPAIATMRLMWIVCMRGFLARAKPGDVLSFNPELLPACINYARNTPGPDGVPREECDRWTESLRLGVIAQECWTEAVRQGPLNQR